MEALTNNNYGGARIGAGKKKGTRHKRTLEREATLQAFRDRVYEMSQTLLRAQAVPAIGYHQMITLTKDAEGKMHTEIVKSEKRISDFLATGVYGKDYMLIVGAEPDYKAADALLNRAYGRPTETIDVGNKDNQPFIIRLNK